jgi:predicted alpha/beta-hydrolase family hydrolase
MAALRLTTLTLDTPRGPARAEIALPGDGHAPGPADSSEPGEDRALVLGHGAGGGIGAVDLQAAREVALARGLAVALVEQPYRVAGRRSAPPAAALDDAWTAVLAQLLAGPLAGRAALCGGRSSGARVACRTAAQTGAVGVVCLAFPLLAPARRDGTRASRLAELDSVAVPVLVVQGRNDRFGIPPPAPSREVVVLAGDHALRSDLPGLRAALDAWLAPPRR